MYILVCFVPDLLLFQIETGIHFSFGTKFHLKLNVTLTADDLNVWKISSVTLQRRFINIAAAVLTYLYTVYRTLQPGCPGPF